MIWMRTYVLLIRPVVTARETSVGSDDKLEYMCL